MTVRLIVVALLLSLAMPLPAHADAIEPQTLWELTQTSRLIVLAEVEAVGDAPGGNDVAQLRVLEVWKGTKPERLEVVFRSRLVCPQPPRYEPGRRVVAFLKRSENSWRTTGLSYGTRYPADDSAVDAYRMAVSMALEAQESAREKQRVEWALGTAVHPATRWDGLYTLVPSPFAAESPAQDDSGQRKGPRLSPRQQRILANAFVQAPLREGTLARMLILLQDYPSQDVDDTALSVLELTLQAPEGPPWDTELAMALIARRLGKPLVPPEPSKPQRGANPKKDVEEPFETSEAFAERMKRQWESFKKANHLSPAPLRRSLSGGPTEE